MDLIARLEASLLTEESYFRSQLLKEDIDRLHRLLGQSKAAESLAAFKKDGTMIGWTPGDTRTWELKSTLDPFLDAFYAATTTPAPVLSGKLDAAWDEFNAHRVALLVGCLSRVPKPIED